MAQVNQSDDCNALQLLAQAAASRRADLNQFGDQPNRSAADEEIESPSPVLDKFFAEGGSKAVEKMNDFSSTEFNAIWDLFRDYVQKIWNMGRGRKSSVKPKDVLFMTLSVLKHSGNWDFLAKMLKMKGPTFEWMIMNFVDVISPYLYDAVVKKWEKRHTMTRLMKDGTTFKHHKFSLYATDVTFQQANRPSENHKEAKTFFSNKHKLYGYNTEEAVLTNGIAIGCTQHFPGSVADITILRRNMEFHSRALSKSDDERRELNDLGTLAEEYQGFWAAILDKGYQGAAEFMRAVLMKNSSRGRIMGMEDLRRNRKIASDRIIVENFFGRLCTLWMVIGNKYRWDQKKYDRLFCLCLALTNLHIKMHPLRAEDGQFFALYKKRLYSIGESIVGKRKSIQAGYRERCRARIALQFPSGDQESGAGAMLN